MRLTIWTVKTRFYLPLKMGLKLLFFLPIGFCFLRTMNTERDTIATLSKSSIRTCISSSINPRKSCIRTVTSGETDTTTTGAVRIIRITAI